MILVRRGRFDFRRYHNGYSSEWALSLALMWEGHKIKSMRVVEADPPPRLRKR